MSFIFIDRRLASKNKSSNNRQKLLRRVKDTIKKSNPHNIGNIDGSGANANPTKIAHDILEEPYFAYGNSGNRTVILIGNEEYLRGDQFDVSDVRSEGGSKGKAGKGEDSEDDFIINISKDEFLDFFFEDCELPFLQKTKSTSLTELTTHKAGFTTNGAPANLSVIESFKRSKGRRIALAGPDKRKIEELEKQILALEEEKRGLILTSNDLQRDNAEQRNIDLVEKEIADISESIEEMLSLISALRIKIASLALFDKIDLRFRNHQVKPIKTTEAVMIVIMDVSGSMGEEEKLVARKFFAILYAFLRRRYSDIDVVFIAHTDKAFELNEDEFFSTRQSGGTQVSTALDLANNIIKERYSDVDTNCYICQASDGDNWGADNDEVVRILESGRDALIDKVQFLSYIEVGESRMEITELWDTYVDLVERNKNMFITKIEDPDEVFPAFKRMFKKKET